MRASYPARFDDASGATGVSRAHRSTPERISRAALFRHHGLRRSQPGGLVDRYGAGHILLGTDYPYDMAEGEPVGLVGALDLSSEDEAKILEGTRRRCWRRPCRTFGEGG